MKVLVINCGSSSVKYQLLNMEQDIVLAKGIVERIGLNRGRIVHQVINKEISIELDLISDHEAALKLVFDLLTGKDSQVVENINEICVIGHRVVHGGTKFSHAVLIDPMVKKAIKDLFYLAPLHNPPNLIGINACAKLAPAVPQVAVFDTAFHQTIPDFASFYGIVFADSQEYGIRRFGFHGTSHRFVSERAAKMLGQGINSSKIITCHLGNGASITAVKNGKSIETSMGLTPLEGLIMGTRCGDVDPAIVLFLMEKKGLSIKEITEYLNHSCGVLGISGESSDFRDLEAAAGTGNKKAQLAIDMFVYRLKKYIGAYMAVLNGADGLVFTAGIGENSPAIREQVCFQLDGIGLKIDIAKNQVKGKEAIISAADSKTKILVIPTNEEWMIAQDALKITLKIASDSALTN